MNDALSITHPGERRIALRRSFRDFGRADPRGAMIAAEGLSRPSERHLAIRSAIEGAGETDPELALVLAMEQQGVLRQQLVVSAIEALTLEDPQRAQAACDAIPDTDMACVQGLFREWAALAPEDAIEVATQYPQQRRQVALYSVFSIWSAQDPSAALDWLRGVSPALIGPDERFSLSSTLVHADPALYDQLSAGLTPHEQHALMRTRLQKLVATDIDAAIAEVPRLAGTQNYTLAITMVAQAWSQNDPAAATRWLLGHSGGREVEEALERTIANWAGSNFESAQAFVESLSASQRRRLEPALAQGRAQRDPESALRWMMEANEDSANPARLGQMIMTVQDWARRDSEAAMNFLVAHSDHALAQTAMSHTLQTIAATDIESAERWLNRLEGTPQHGPAVGAVVQAMADFDFDESLRWTRQQTGQIRDHTVTAVARSANGEPNDELFTMIQAIQNNELRQQAVAYYAQRVRQSDPNHAREIVATSDLSQDAKAFILRSLRLN
ncbi:MAG: hypothetical protein AAFU65_01885 [Pseudomonadota bacterium]